MTSLHAHIVNVVGLFLLYLWCMLFNLHILLWTISLSFVWIFLIACSCFNPSPLTCRLFCLLVCVMYFYLTCSFQDAYYYMLPRSTLPFPFVVRTAHASYWISAGSHTCFNQRHCAPPYAFWNPRHIIKHPIVGTPTPNGVRSSWDFISESSPKFWQV